jgi:hypothetical protein
MRVRDRDRAYRRRTHQLGETDEQYAQRLRTVIEALAIAYGAEHPKVTITPNPDGGFTADITLTDEPLARASGKTLAALIPHLRAGLQRLRNAGLIGPKPKPPAQGEP